MITHNRKRNLIPRPVMDMVSLLLITWISISNGSAADLHDANQDMLRLKVANAGLALAGSKATLKEQFTHTVRLEDELQNTLNGDIKQIKPLHYTLTSDGLSNTNAGDTVSLALVIDKESVIQRKIAGIHQVIIDIVAMAVVFDFDEEEKAVIATYPVPSNPCIESYSDHRPTHQDIHQLVRDYYFKGVCGEQQGLIKNYTDLIKTAAIQQKYNGEVGIGKVSISAKAASLLPVHWQNNPDLAQHYLASSLARNISQYQELSVVPFQIDNAVTSMSLRFTGTTDTILLSLPEPDYLFDIHLQGLGNKLQEKKAAGSSYIYATRINLSLRDAFFDDSDAIFNHSLKYGVGVRIAASQKTFMEWESYDAAIYGLFREFSKNIAQPSREWLRLQGMDKSQQRRLSALNKTLANLKF